MKEDETALLVYLLISYTLASQLINATVGTRWLQNHDTSLMSKVGDEIPKKYTEYTSDPLGALLVH